jgi:hypothetical protein
LHVLGWTFKGWASSATLILLVTIAVVIGFIGVVIAIEVIFLVESAYGWYGRDSRHNRARSRDGFGLVLFLAGWVNLVAHYYSLLFTIYQVCGSRFSVYRLACIGRPYGCAKVIH